MRRKLALLSLIGVIPLIGYLVARFVHWRFEAQWLSAVKRDLGDKGVAAVHSGALSLGRYCSSVEGLKEDACATYNHVALLRDASVASVVVGFALLLAIVIAARAASANRNLLVALFAPGIKIVLFVLFALIIVQGAIATYGAYVLEAVLIHRVHFFLIGGIGLGAVAGAFTMISAGLSISRRAKSLVIGKAVLAGEQPRLWEFVAGLAQKLGARAPRQVVVGLEPNFYVTSADVAVVPGATATHPPTADRVQALGLCIADLRNEALQIASDASSALLLDKLEELEEFLTQVEHQVLLELGHAKLPEAEAERTVELRPCPACRASIPAEIPECPQCGSRFAPGIDGKAAGIAIDPAPRQEKALGACSNCRSAIPLDARECPYCNVLFGSGSDWKIERRA